MVFIATEVTGDEELKKLIEKLPTEVGDAVVEDVSDFLVNVFALNPPFKHVTRKRAYPETGDGFFSDKQRRWFFANLAEGNISGPSAANRTQRFSRGWRKIGTGKEILVVNETSYGPFLMGSTERARLSELAGWSTMDEVIDSRRDRIKRIIRGTAKRVMKKLGLKVS